MILENKQSSADTTRARKKIVNYVRICLVFKKLFTDTEASKTKCHLTYFIQMNAKIGNSILQWALAEWKRKIELNCIVCTDHSRNSEMENRQETVNGIQFDISGIFSKDNCNNRSIVVYNVVSNCYCNFVIICTIHLFRLQHKLQKKVQVELKTQNTVRIARCVHTQKHTFIHICARAIHTHTRTL